MVNTEKIKHLQEAHRVLDKQIEFLQTKHPHVEEVKLVAMKKQKLKLKDQIEQLIKEDVQ